MDPELTERAMLRAREITRIFDHTRPNGESFSSVLDGSSCRDLPAEKILLGEHLGILRRPW